MCSSAQASRSGRIGAHVATAARCGPHDCKLQLNGLTGSDPKQAMGCQRGLSAMSGFTLIEVLVALTIVAVALMASLRAVGALTQGSSELQTRTLAQWSAENRLALIRVQAEFPAVGRRRYDCSQGRLVLICQEDVYATPNTSFRRVEMSVYDGNEGPRVARLVGFATNLP